MSPPCVLLAGFDPPALDQLRPELETLASVRVAGSREEVLDVLERHGAEVVCLGPAFSGPAARDLVAAGRRYVVLAAGSDAELFEGPYGDGSLFYVSRRPPPAEDVVAIVRAALDDPRLSGGAAGPARGICELADSLAYETDPRRFSLGVARAVRELTGADRARCLLYDSPSGSLSAWEPRGADPRDQSATAGLAGWVARTGRAVCSDRAGDDARFVGAADDPAGGGDERLLALPVALPRLAAEGPPGVVGGTPVVLAVLVAARSGDGAPFTLLERRRLELLADRLAPAFGRLGRRDGDPGAGAGAGAAGGPFTAESLRHYGRDGDDLGQPVEVSPRWTRWAFPLMVLALAAGLAYAAVTSVGEYARGIAVIQRDGAGASLVAAFPARYRPRLAPGLPVHVEIDGYDSGSERPAIGSVGEIVGADEASRRLGLSGEGRGTGPPLAGPVVVVRCPLPEAGGAGAAGDPAAADRYLGLAGTAEVRVGSERLVFSLVPSLRGLLGGGDG